MGDRLAAQGRPEAVKRRSRETEKMKLELWCTGCDLTVEVELKSFNDKNVEYEEMDRGEDIVAKLQNVKCPYCGEDYRRLALFEATSHQGRKDPETKRLEIW